MWFNIIVRSATSLIGMYSMSEAFFPVQSHLKYNDSVDSEDRVGPETRQRQNRDGRAVQNYDFFAVTTFINKFIKVIFLFSRKKSNHFIIYDKQILNFL